MTSDDRLGPDGTVYLDAYLHLADTHRFGASCMPCSRAQAISVNTAIRLAGKGSTFGELQRRLKCGICGGCVSLVLCSDPRPARTREQDGPAPETLGW